MIEAWTPEHFAHLRRLDAEKRLLLVTTVGPQLAVFATGDQLEALDPHMIVQDLLQLGQLGVFARQMALRDPDQAIGPAIRVASDLIRKGVLA